MLSSSKSLYRLAALVGLWLVISLVAISQTTPQSLRQKDVKPVSTGGKQTFASSCASCHGLDGKGGERAPNIADAAKVQRLSDAQIFRIIEDGVPGTGMPASHSLESSQIDAVVRYLRTLQGRGQSIKLPGDPKRGKTVFFGKPGCSGCHMFAGKGGFIASDLSGYGRTHAVEQTRNAIIHPTPSSDSQARLVTATIRGGEKYVGRIRNEDNFSLQLQALDGTFHSISKSDIERLEYDSQTLMPSDYGSRLPAGDLNDLISYLMNAATSDEVKVEQTLDEEQ